MQYENEVLESPMLLLEKIIKNLVSVPDSVDIYVTEGEATTILSIDVVPEDRGKIIGKRGCIIEALKTLFNAMGCKKGRAIILEIRE